MSEDTIQLVVMRLMAIMQVSILVPMAVVWYRQRHFSTPIKWLSWYVYLSAASSLGATILYPAYLETNYGFSIGFNLGKIALLAAVYHQVIPRSQVRQLLLASSVAAIVGTLWLTSRDMNLAAAVGRVGQCAMLAAYALVYLSLTLNNPRALPPTRDPMWLLSVGQLIYSAGTVTAFSLDYVTTTIANQPSKYILIAIAGLIFNYFLTLVFLRAGLPHPQLKATRQRPVRQLAS